MVKEKIKEIEARIIDIKKRKDRVTELKKEWN